jgi:competence protein ComGF
LDITEGDTEIRKIIGMAKGTFINMKSLLTSKQITNKLKVRTARCYVYSILLYGAKSWTLNKLMDNVGIQMNTSLGKIRKKFSSVREIRMRGENL